MFGDYASRLTRTQWSNFRDDAGKPIGLDMFSEELATMLRSNAPLTQRATLTINPPDGAPGLVLSDATVVRGLMTWAKATANWTNAAGNGSYVDCRKCSDSSGTLVDPPATVRVYLPRGGSGRDPNVRTGDVLAYTEDASGNAVGATFALDDPIGTRKFWGGSAGSIPGGWQQVSAAAGRFPVVTGGSYTLDGTGGAATHTHTGASVDLSSLTIGSATTSITIDDHSTTDLEHTHDFYLTPDFYGNTGTPPYVTEGGTDRVTEPGGPSSPLAHNVSDPGHTHSGGGGSGDVTIPNGDNVPPWFGVGLLIERIS